MAFRWACMILLFVAGGTTGVYLARRGLLWFEFALPCHIKDSSGRWGLIGAYFNWNLIRNKRERYYPKQNAITIKYCFYIIWANHFNLTLSVNGSMFCLQYDCFGILVSSLKSFSSLLISILVLVKDLTFSLEKPSILRDIFCNFLALMRSLSQKYGLFLK